MEALETSKLTCVVVGASHAGVNFAFALRKEGWQGQLILIDADPDLPYHRPPLSKTYLSQMEESSLSYLKAEETYARENIQLNLGRRVLSIDREARTIQLDDGTEQAYDKLVLATGASAWVPEVAGLEADMPVFSLRNAGDVRRIQVQIGKKTDQRAVIVGGGFIGLELAASLQNMGLRVTVLEREERVLSRVTAPDLSHYFQKLHQSNGVEILLNQELTRIQKTETGLLLKTKDGRGVEADLVVFGVGIRVNAQLAQQAGLDVSGGIAVDTSCRTEDDDIYAIGDCTLHFNRHYQRYLRLESVQNAVDQAKVAAAAILGKDVAYDAIPWFWSDQYDVKLQMVGLSQGFDRCVLRSEAEHSFSLWYFKAGQLLAVDAVNAAKAYVWGTKYLKSQAPLDPVKVGDLAVDYNSFLLLPESQANNSQIEV
ncbi:FAD-dependent oxidoreductase [Algoriphagus jejuensis]|uniref:FAD-dependent oxidoreductase n=1 Tax=Algoriphagus jejuensis TaxID=419934 RepID=A0ABP3YMB8_9BACT